MAAQSAADAAAALCQSNPKDAEDTTRADAEEGAELARRYNFARELLEQMVLNQYKWVLCDLQPVTVTNPQPE